MTRTILVGYDGSSEADDALALADLVATALDASLVAAAVYRRQPSFGTVAWGEYEATERTAVEEALAAAPETTRPLARRTVGAGSPAHGLHQLATELGASLIVVGSTHRGTVGRLAIGSTGERLLHGASCPVLVAPKGFAAEPRAIHRVGVAFDGSEEARQALGTAARLSELAGAPLRLVWAVEEPVAFAYGGPAVSADLLEDLERYAEVQSERALLELPDGVRAEAEVLVGSPGEVLAGRSAELDLLVCGSRGYGLVRQVLLGGVSGRLMREAACPVLVVPRGARGLEVPAPWGATVALDRFDITVRFEGEEGVSDQIGQALADAFEVPTATAARASGVRATEDSVEVTFYEVTSAPPAAGQEYAPPRPEEPTEAEGRGALRLLADLPEEAEVVVPIVRALVAVSAARQRAGLSPRQRVSITVEPSPVHSQEELRHS